MKHYATFYSLFYKIFYHIPPILNMDKMVKQNSDLYF